MRKKQLGKCFRRIIYSLAILIACILTTGTTKVQAEEAQENSTWATAQEVSANTIVTGQLSYDYDIDWYKVYVAEQGYISLEFSHEYYNNNYAGWCVSLIGQDGEKCYYSFYSLKCDDVISGAKIGVSSGWYYIEIFDINRHKYSSVSDMQYRFQFNYVKSNEWEVEDNNAKENAININANTNYSGTIYYSQDIDWYKVHIDTDGVFSLTFNHEYEPYADTDRKWKVTLMDDKKRTFQSFEVNGKKGAQSGKIGLPKGNYYLMVQSCDKYDDYKEYWSDKVYTFSINHTPTTDWEIEYNDNKGIATNLLLNTTMYGSTYTSGDKDWYVVHISQKGYVQLDMEAQADKGSDTWEMSLYDQYEKELSTYDVSSGEGVISSPCIGLPAGTYYIKVDSGNESTYSLRLNYTQADNWEQEFNNEMDTANEVELERSINASLYSDYDVDYYKFTLSQETNVAFEFLHDTDTGTSQKWHMGLYHSDGSMVETYTDEGYYDTEPVLDEDISVGDISSIYGVGFLPAGSYYLKITCSYDDDYSPVNYAIHLSKFLYVQTITVPDEYAKTLGDKVFSIGASANGDGTLTYASDNEEVATVNKSGKVTIKGVGTAIITVSASQTNLFEAATKQIVIKVSLKTPTLSSVKLSGNVSFDLTWKKDASASGYEIYRKEDSDEYEKIKTVNSATILEYTDKNLNENTKYTYKMRSFKNVIINGKEQKVYSGWSKTKSGKTKENEWKIKSVKLADKNFTYNGKTIKPTVKIKDEKGNTLKKNTHYTVKYAKGCKEPGKYKVTVTYKGKYSDNKKKTLTFTIKPKNVAISKVTAKSKGINVKWKKGSKITGYEIQYSTDKKFTSKKTKSVTIKNAKTTSKSITKLSAKKKYYVRVRTYKSATVDGKCVKIYSDWSKVKSVTTKK